MSFKENDDSDDDAMEYQDDPLVQDIGDFLKEENFNWASILPVLNEKLDTLISPAQRFEYLQTVMLAGDTHPELMRIIAPVICELSDKIYSIDDIMDAALISARHCTDQDDIKKALNILHDNYRRSNDDETKMEALIHLLNHPSNSDEKMIETDRLLDYYDDWQVYSDRLSPDINARYAYSVLSGGHLINGMKPYMVRTIFDKIDHVKDAYKRLDMIFLCNKIIPSDDVSTIHDDKWVEPDYIPELPGYTWNEHFYRAVFKSINDNGSTNTWNYVKVHLNSEEQTFHPQLQQAFEIVENIPQLMELYNFVMNTDSNTKQSENDNSKDPQTEINQEKVDDYQIDEPYGFYPRCAADFLRFPLRHLKWAANMQEMMFEDDTDHDDIHSENPLERECYEQISLAYDTVKRKIERSHRKGLDDKIAYCDFKQHFLIAACAGDPYVDANIDDLIIRDDTGLWPTTVAYINNQLFLNKLARDYLIGEKQTTEAQKQLLSPGL